MRKMILMLVLALIVGLTASVCFSEEKNSGEDYGNFCPGGRYWGPGEHGYGMSRGGWHHGGSGWRNLTPEQREKWGKIWGAYLKDTLELRKQLMSKQLELEMLWHQPELDEKRIGALSGEEAELETQLLKKHNAYLIQCRKDFGGQGWSCPGGQW